MNKTLKAFLAIIGLLIVVWGAYSVKKPASMVEPTPTPTDSPVATAPSYSYQCNEGKTIDVLNGKDGIQVTLSDGRSMALKQTRSADGVRYANADESFVFWSKGNGALVLENNQSKSYIGCMLTPQDPGGLSKVYVNGTEGFALRYPEGFIVDESFKDTMHGPKVEAAGVKFTIPQSMATGTNLSNDSFVSVESVPNTQECTADKFIDHTRNGVVTVTDGDMTYSMASSSDAAAGNRYDEWVYALPGTNPCRAVHYFIHYGAIGNYPKGKVQEFDEKGLVSLFDSIRRTLELN